MSAEAQAYAYLQTPTTNQLPWRGQFHLLLRLQFKEYKHNALFFLLFSLIMPLGVLWLLHGYIGGSPQEAAWLMASNTVLSISLGSVTFAASRVGFMRIQKELDYYACLPISKSAFAAALFCLTQLSVLPGVCTSLIIARFVVGAPVLAILAAVPLALLAGASLTVVGAMVGSLARTTTQLHLYSNLIYVCVMFLSPVLVPMTRLPLVLRVASYLLPHGQATIALSGALMGEYGQQFWTLVGALILWLLFAGTVGLRQLSWRSD